MMTHFMGDVSLKEPLQYEYVSAMTGIITDTAQYNGEKDAIGYTFRYFLEGLHQEQNVKYYLLMVLSQRLKILKIRHILYLLIYIV